MEENNIENSLQITDDVVSVIAGAAIKDIEGVQKVSGSFADGISEAFGKKSLGRGVKVELDGTDAKIEVAIIVKYGVKIPEVAKKIQDKIKQDVESMTGYKVSNVTVKIQGIETVEKEEENNKEDQEETNKNEE